MCHEALKKRVLMVFLVILGGLRVGTFCWDLRITPGDPEIFLPALVGVW